MITEKELKQKLKYFPKTGNFRWRIQPRNGINIGDVAGTNKDGYVNIQLNKKLYKAHRLAFLYMEGYFPENDVDHINRIRKDNRWENLRHVSRQCNIRNIGLSKNNKSGVTGVSWANHINKWSVEIKVNYIKKYLGSFKGFTKAVHTRWKAECKYNWNNCNSTSPAYRYLKNKGLI